MRAAFMGAMVACALPLPAHAVTTVSLGNATHVSYAFTFDKPVTGVIELYVVINRLFPRNDGYQIAIEGYDALFFNNSRFALGQFRGQKLGGSGYAGYGDLEYTVKVSPALTPTLRLSTAYGIPEPATWALMILGFGAVGGALRRRVRVAAVA